MPETILEIDEARTALSELIDRAAVGEEIVIAKAGHPLAKRAPRPGHLHRREPGGW